MAATKTTTKTATRTATRTANRTATKTAQRKIGQEHKPTAFETLLAQAPAQSPIRAPQRADGIAIGVITAVGEALRVGIPSMALHDLCAASMVQLGEQHLGQSVALGFEGADANKPIVLGLMMAQAAPMMAQAAPLQTAAAHSEHDRGQTVQVSRDGQHVVIEAQTELELRCGEAVILLSADGTVQLRGKYVTTDAIANIRLRGGSVQIN